MEWWRRLRRRSRRQLLADGLVLLGLTAFVVLVYVVLVLGGGALIGHTDSPDVALSVLATAVVALAFDPVQTRLEHAVSQAVLGGRPSPYDALRSFSATVTGSQPAEELPERMARVLADGTGADWAQVWLVVDGRPQLAATWPPESDGEPSPPGLDAPMVSHDARGRVCRSLPVRHGGEVLGQLVLREPAERELSTVEARLFAGLADQAGPVLHGARLRTQLEQRVTELSARVAELRTSRQRLVEAQDSERQVLERNIHDGAQQHLVALAVNLRLAETLVRRSRDRAEAFLREQEVAAREAIDVLVALSRGIYPSTLHTRGLAVALTAAVANSPIPVEVHETEVGRYDAAVEATAYFCCLEAVQNAAKHSDATVIRVLLDGRGSSLSFSVEDDGIGFEPATTPVGTGLANLRDRVESVGGTLTTATRPGGGTRVMAQLPTAAATLPRTRELT